MKKSKINLPLSSVLLLLVLAFLAVFRQITYSDFEFPTGKVELVAKISGEPRVFGTTQYFKIADLSVKTDASTILSKGDRVKLTGLISDNQMLFPKVEIINKNDSQISKIRHFFAGRVKESLPKPYSDLVLGMVLGIDDFSSGSKDILRSAGTIHAVVVSGQNISLLAGLVLGLVGLIKRKFAILLALLAILFYAFLTGFAPPAVRAVVMGTLVLWGQFFGRQTQALLILTISGLLMLVVEPKLLSDLSFQLSFAATGGILIISPILQARLTKLPKLLAESASVSMAAYLVTLPILGFTFDQISVVSIFANLFAYPVLLPSLILSILATIFSPIPFLNLIFAYLALPTLWLFWQISVFFANLPLATLGVNPSTGFVWIYYFVLGVVFLILPRKLRHRRLLG